MVITTLKHRLHLDFFSWLCLHGKPMLKQTSGNDLWTHGERRPCWSSFAGRTCGSMGDSSWCSAFLKGPTVSNLC